MPGTIAIIAQDTARYTLFSVCLYQIKHPPQTSIDWGLSTDVAGARNELVRRALDRGSEWVLFIDDDHVYPSDLLNRLLSHEKDVVSALYLRRARPFSPLAFTGCENGNQYIPLELTGLAQQGLLRIHAAGAGGLLIRSHVFEAIPEPWFEYGRVGEWHASEDIIMCEKISAAGFEIYVDLEAQLGHLSPSAIWPSYVDDQWSVGFTVADGLKFYSPFGTKQ